MSNACCDTHTSLLRLLNWESFEPYKPGVLFVEHRQTVQTRISVSTFCLQNILLTLKAPIVTKIVFFPRLLKCLRSLYGKQCGPRSDCSYIGEVCSGSTLFVSILNLSVMLGNYLQQMTTADDIFRMHFS